jgi:hypothetical protein
VSWRLRSFHDSEQEKRMAMTPEEWEAFNKCIDACKAAWTGTMGECLKVKPEEAARACMDAKVVGEAKCCEDCSARFGIQVPKPFSDYQKGVFTDISDFSGINAATFGMLAGVYAVVVRSTGGVLITLIIVASASALSAAWFNMMSHDPSDPNFQKIATSDYPKPISVKPDPKDGVSRTIASALNAVIANYSRSLGNLIALSTSINRAGGAHAAGNARAEARQMSAARTFARRAAGLLEKGPELRAHAADLLEEQGLEVSATATQVSNAKSTIEEKGFPKIVDKTIAQYLTKKEDRVTASIVLKGAIHKVSNRKLDFARLLRSTKVASAELRAARALRDFAS